MRETLIGTAQRGITDSKPRIDFAHTGSGKRILLVIGFSMRADIWRPQIEDLGRTHHVAWFDNRGIANSETGTRLLPTIQDYARDGLRVLQSLGWDQDVHLVGVSMGGMIAQELALLAPRRFRSLTLIATHPGGSLGTKLPPWQGMLRFVGSFWMPKKYRSRSISKILYPEHFLKKMDRDALKQRIDLQLGRPASKAVMLKQMLAVLRFDTSTRLGDLSLPTLILRAGEDILVKPGNSQKLMNGLPNGKLVNFEDAGHGLIFQYAAEVNKAIRQHVERNSARAS